MLQCRLVPQRAVPFAPFLRGVTENITFARCWDQLNRKSLKVHTPQLSWPLSLGNDLEAVLVLCRICTWKPQGASETMETENPNRQTVMYRCIGKAILKKAYHLESFF